MTKNRTKLERLQRELAKREPAESIVLRMIWHDEATGEAVIDGKGSRVIQLRWPEDEDDKEPTRQDAPERPRTPQNARKPCHMANYTCYGCYARPARSGELLVIFW